MTLMTIRLELGQTRDFPRGDPSHGYEFTVPFDAPGNIDETLWQREKDHCGVRRFRPGEPDRFGHLHHDDEGWYFGYGSDRREEGEILVKFDWFVLEPGLYVSVTEEDGRQHPFRIAFVKPESKAA